ncbi:nucleophile aminohydrolase [Cercophora scortea]|uniref:Nucleophile aminohydrolase n=1 Tax=Cercophora scortea TaxID=314031 RepID=A0AAE0I9F3_9PEZI|nr:nucleophile aminohydrolase [Cercophora scortea]
MSKYPRHGTKATGVDGTSEKIWKRGPKPPVAAIFIHAGAGYHSIANEKVHLEACSEAARVGLRFLRAGAPAPDAVEAAIKCLEDKEITNAGFGSNLNMDGVVECDATIVDHLGRSGACGAVPGIKNPISLAKLILDASSQPLSLRRVPPNILVGVGAQEFAEEHGMSTTLNEYLVSKNAKDRYMRWNEDLRKAEARLSAAAAATSVCNYPDQPKTPPTPTTQTLVEYDRAANVAANPSHLRDHTSAILTGTWNEGQPDSPHSSGSPAPENGSPVVPPSSARSSQSPTPRTAPNGQYRTTDRSPLSFMSAAFQSRSSPSPKRPKVRKSVSDDPSSMASRLHGPSTVSPTASSHDGSVSTEEDLVDDDPELLAHFLDAPCDVSMGGTSGTAADAGLPQESSADLDMVTDTIGAIAIDLKGNIAAGSSSGGIGMKHRGRIGPAALVGIGTAVVPEDPDDEWACSVAAVTSGTGEHMATTIASAKCAERLFTDTRRGPGGRDIEEVDEHHLMESFILDDFMNHPGVRNQPSTGAIGVMAVKKDRTGIYFYFAHNTDSFALASMSSAEREPSCVMSRLGKNGPVAQGGRKIRVD